MLIKIRLLGNLSSLNGFYEKEVGVEKISIKELIKKLKLKLVDYYVLVNGLKVDEDSKLNAGSLVVFMPLIEGG